MTLTPDHWWYDISDSAPSASDKRERDLRTKLSVETCNVRTALGLWIQDEISDLQRRCNALEMLAVPIPSMSERIVQFKRRLNDIERDELPSAIQESLRREQDVANGTFKTYASLTEAYESFDRGGRAIQGDDG